MQINYELTPESYFKALDQITKVVAKPTWKSHLIRFMIVMVFVLPFVWFLVQFFDQQSIIAEMLCNDCSNGIQSFLESVETTNRWLSILGVILLVWARCLTYFEIAYLRSRVFSHYSPYLMENKIELREEGLYHKSKSGHSLSFYETLSVIQTQDFVAVMLDQGLVGHCVPKTAFENQAQIDEFIAIIQGKLAAKVAE